MASQQSESRNETLQNLNVNEEKMATVGEGKVADAVQQKHGAQNHPGDNPVKIDDFASDIERKKAEQEEARQAIHADRQAGVDIDGSLGEGRTFNESIRDV